MGTKTNSGLFIIESLRLRDEKNDWREGDIISKMLHLAGKKKTKYCYIRTFRELEEMIRIFGKSKYRYLHITCHADKFGFDTTFDAVSYTELGKMLRLHLRGRRVFVSACQMANKIFAKELFRDSELLSLTGPREDISIDTTATFWVSFYHLMFKIDYKKMGENNLRKTIKQLSEMYDENINYFGARKENHGFKLWPIFAFVKGS